MTPVLVPPDVRRLAFARLIDSAGMFPPAREPLDVAAAAYRAARRSDPIGLYGRLLVPGRLVGDLAGHVAAGTVDAGWGIGAVLAPGAGRDDVADLAEALAAAPGLRLESVELREPDDGTDLAGPDGLLARLRALAGRRPLSVYVEVTPERAARSLPRLAGLDVGGVPVGAKLRCGGLRAQDFPAPAAVASFLRSTRDLGLTMKATQGLHHPFRQVDAATGALQHGFVNLIAALALPPDGLDLEAVVAEADPEAFGLDANGLRWRGLRAEPARVGRARTVLAGIGSCSLEEPLDDLRGHGMLP